MRSDVPDAGSEKRNLADRAGGVAAVRESGQRTVRIRRKVPARRRPEGAETAVEIINEKSTRIYNKRDSAVCQVVINTLSEDNNQMNNEYIRMDKDGKITGVTHVTYIRRKTK
jgi:hypothetical protein